MTRLTAAAASVLMAASLAAPAAAQQAGDGADDRFEVAALTFVGIEQLDEGPLRDVLATRPSPWLPWSEPSVFDPDDFELDLRRIVAYYRDHGFPDVAIASHDVAVNAAEREVDITVVVEEGEPIVVRDIVFDGFDVLPPARLEALRAGLLIAEGERAEQTQILAAGEQAVAALKNEGYAYAQVRVERGPLESAHDLRVRYVAAPGTQAFFGPITVAGNDSVDANIVRRQLGYRPGQLYRLDQVRDGQRRLYSLPLFQFATIESLEGEGPSEVPTRVTVAEADHRRLVFSVGWGTEEHANGEASWRHVNFQGGARTLAARGKWSSLERGGEVDFRQPYLFHPALSLSLNGHGWYADELAYSARSEGGRAALEGRLSRRALWRATYTHEFASSRVSNAALQDLAERDTLIALGLDPTTGVQDGMLSSIAFELQHATVENPLDPRDGYAASLFVEQAGTLLAGSYHYTNVSADVRGYLPITGHIGLAGRVHGAVIDPVGQAGDVPFFKRYFLGGSTSLRGWGRFEVAPLSGAGLPLGGFSLFETSAELRTTPWDQIGLVFFVDAGNVWREAWDLQLGDLRYDAGPGLRYRTPIGPLRVDLAYQLNPIEGLLVNGEPQARRWRVHFSIGQSF